VLTISDHAAPAPLAALTTKLKFCVLKGRE